MKRLIDSLPYQRILHSLFLKSKQEHPNHLDLLLVRVEELHLMLASHINHSTNQFTYLQGQITALLSQIKDLMQKSELDSESDAF